MKLSWLLFFTMVLATLFMACEKEINIPIKESDPKLVVEGSIATDQRPAVVLTLTTGFFSKISTESIVFVKDAEVWVTDLTTNKKVQLQPLTIDFVTAYTVFETDPLFNDFKVGISEHAYKLEISYEDELYTAISKVPSNSGLDSLYFERETQFDPDEFYILKADFTDPDTIGNYYKYFTQRRGTKIRDQQFREPFTSRFDDTYINGKTLPADLFLGYDETDVVDNEFVDRLSYSEKGDTIIIKLSAMDFDVYDFWKTFDFAEGSVGNPFASPIQVQSNISNDAFGVWGAYGNTYDTIINK